MKKINLLLIVTILSNVIFAQQKNNLQDILNKLEKENKEFYNSIDKSRMQTNVFFNKGFLVLNDLENSYKKIPFIINNRHWLYLYNSISHSFTDNTKLKPDTLLLTEINKKIINENTAIITSIFYKGDYLPVDNLIQVKLNNVPPDFKTLYLFAGAIFKEHFHSQVINFVFHPEFFISNAKNDIKKILINFEDGSNYREIDINDEQIYTVKYQSQGEKSLRFKLITKNNDTLISYTKITVSFTQIKPTFKGRIYFKDTADFVLFKNYNYTKSDPDVDLSYANYEYYESCDGVLDKPVIIAEGFDILGNMSAEYLHDSWNSYYSNYFISTLKSKGYDIFCVNFRAPDHKLQNNAKIIKALIKGINEHKTSNFEGIYIGESMAGLLGRIALKKLENEDYDHQIGLYVSFDSPQKGAYMPLALQCALEDINQLSGNTLFTIGLITDIIEEIFGWDIPYVDVYHMLNSKAAKQMLVKHYNDWGASNHETFQDYLNDLGYPTQCRNIAFSNGSNQSLSQGVQSTHFFHANLPTPIIMFPYHISIIMDGWFPTVGCCAYETLEKTQVYFHNVMWSSLDFSISFTHTYQLQPMSYYNSPGGKFDYETLHIYPSSNVSVGKFSFVPVASAIDYKNFSHETDLYFYNENSPYRNTQYLIDHNLIPFDDIYADVDNSWHTTKEDDIISDILIQEIMPDKMYIQNRIIDKNRDFEATQSITAGKDVSGTLVSSLHTKHIKKQEVRIKSGTTVTFTAGEEINLEDGFEVEEGANFTAGLGQICGSKSSDTSLPVVPPIIIGKSAICGKAKYTVKCDNNCSISWQLIGENIYLSASGNEFNIDTLPYGQYTLYCTRTTENGTATSTKVIRTKCPQNYETPNHIFSKINDNKNNVIIFPNPTSKELEIQSKEQITSISIFNASGSIMLKTDLNSYKKQIDISDLQKGIYFIKVITSSGKNYTKKIIKQ